MMFAEPESCTWIPRSKRFGLLPLITAVVAFIAVSGSLMIAAFAKSLSIAAIAALAILGDFAVGFETAWSSGTRGAPFQLLKMLSE